MKYFKHLLLLIFFLPQAYASKVQIYFELEQKQMANIVRTIFQDKYNIPKELIEVKKTTNCRLKDERYLEVCVQRNKELIILSKDIERVKRPLKIFTKS